MNDRARTWWYYAGLVARLVVGGVWIAAGWLKLPDPAEGVRAVRAFQILPEAVVPTVGYGLPVLEIVIGAMLVVGLATRVAGGLSALLQLAFIIGIASVWARGIEIECGCFGGGGPATNATDQYPWDIARDTGLFALSALLCLFPYTFLSLDRLLGIERQDD